jgi:hypothetical protein
MAKLFYSLEEAADRLGKSEDEVQHMAETGQLQEFRDRDRLMFKVEQVDLLAGDHSNEDTGETIPLADSGGLEGISLASESGSAMNLESPKEQTGISIFDTEDAEEADPAAATMVTTESPGFTGDPTASGSGLLDMTREADDTSLGADLLEDIYSGDTGGETVGESVAGVGAGEALFEETGGVETDTGGPVTIITAETIDSGWSGIAAGVSVGVLVVVAIALGAVLTSLIGTYEGSLFAQIADFLKGLPGGPAFAMLYIGAGIVALFAIIFGFAMKNMK